MAITKPVSPARVLNNSRVYPASIYSRAAISPLYKGTLSRVNNANQFELSLRRMATSPFSVNSESYMDTVRARYGYNDKHLSNAFGIVGGVIGTGVAAAAQAGVRFSTKGIKIGVPKVVSQVATRNAINNAAKLNKNVLRIPGLDNATTATLNSTLENASKVFKQAGANKALAEKALAAARLESSAADVIKTAEDAVKVADEALAAARKTVQNTAADLSSRTALQVSDDFITGGGKILNRAGGFAPVIGTAIDVASLGFSSAQFAQALQGKDVVDIILSGLELGGDATAVAGDAITLAGLAPLGELVSGIGTAVSIGIASLRVGWMVGETTGRSLTPSGLHAQSLFAQNALSNVMGHTLSTIGTILVQMGVPYGVGKLGRMYATTGNKALKAVTAFPYFLSENVIGNQLRAGLTMGISQAVAPLTRELDKMIAPDAPEETDFVSVISLFGDVQDNLYGATRNKAILQGLVEGDPQARITALSRAWGQSDDPAYTLTAADVLEKTAIAGAPPVLKSILGVAGELLLDPRNYNEVLQRKAEVQLSQLRTRVIEAEANRLELAYHLNPTDPALAKYAPLFDPSTGLLRNASGRTTIINIRNAIVAYGSQRDAKKLFKELEKIAVAKNKGITITTVTELPKQMELFKDLIDSVENGSYVSPRMDTNLLIQRLKDTRTEYDTYVKTKEIPVGKVEADMANIKKFLDFFQRRYPQANWDTVVDKIVLDFNVTFNPKLLTEYIKASDSFLHYMNFTDDLNSTLVAVMNPIAKAIQTAGPKALHYINEKARVNTTSGENVMRTLTQMKETLRRLEQIPKIKEVIDEISTRSDEEETLIKTLSGLVEPSKRDEVLAARMQELAETDPVLKQLIADNDARTQVLGAILDKLREQISLIEKQREEAAIGYHEYKNKSGTLVLKRDNIEEYEREFAALEAIQTSKDPDQYAEKQRTKERYNLLKHAIGDYHLMVDPNSIFHKLVSQYEAVIHVMNTVNARLEDSTINLIMGMHSFKELVNTFVPVDRVAQLYRDVQRKTQALDAHLERTTEAQATADELEKEVLAYEATWGTGLDYAERRRRELTTVPKNAYALKVEELEKAKGRVKNLKADTANYREQVEKAVEAHKSMERFVASGKAKEAVTTVFDTGKHLELFEKLDALQKVYALNGYAFTVSYKDKNGIEVTVNVNDTNRTISSVFYEVKNIEGVVQHVGVQFKRSFRTQMNRLFNQYLSTDVFDALLNYQHKEFDMDLEHWKGLTEDERRILIIKYIQNSPLTVAQKESLLRPKMLRGLYMRLNSYMSKDSRYETVMLGELTSSDVMQYVMQQRFKLYRGVDLSQSNDAVVKTLVNAAASIKRIDDEIAAALTPEQQELYADNLQMYRDTLEKYLSSTPVYRYIKAYLYDYINHDVNKVSLFKRTSIEDVMPSGLTKANVKATALNLESADRLLEEFVDADLVEFFVDEYDIKQLGEDRRVQMRMGVKDPDTGELKPVTPEELEIQQRSIDQALAKSADDLDFAQELDVINTFVQAPVKDSDDIDVVHKAKMHEDIALSFDIIPLHQFDIKEVPLFKNAHGSEEDAQLYLLDILANNPNVGLQQGAYIVRLQMRQYLGVDGVWVKFSDILKKSKRDQALYRDAVEAYVSTIISLVAKYPENLKIQHVKQDKDSSVYKNALIDYYLKTGYIDVKTRYSERSKQVQDDHRYTNLYRQELLRQVRHHGRTVLAQPNFSKLDAEAYLKQLVANKAEPSNRALLLELYEKTTREVRRTMRDQRQLVFVRTLERAADELRDTERFIYEGIAEQRATLSPSVRIQSYMKSKRIRALYQDLAEAGENNPDSKHIVFKILRVLQDYITEDYKGKKLLKTFQDFTSIEVDKDGDVFFAYTTKEGKELINIYDLLLTYRIGIDDYMRLIQTVGDRMAGSMAIETVNDRTSAARARYHTAIDGLKGFITYNTLDVTKEAFMRQVPEGKEAEAEHAYEVLSDYRLFELSERLSLKPSLFSKGAKIDPVLFYHHSAQTQLTRLLAAENEKEKFSYFVVDEEKGIKISWIDPQGKRRDVPTMLLLAMLHTPSIRESDRKTLIQQLFFYDVNAAEGRASNTNIDEYKRRLAFAEKRYAEGVATQRDAKQLRLLEGRIRMYKDMIAHFLAIQKEMTFDPRNNFKEFYAKLKADDDYAATIFNSVYDTDADNKVLVKTPNGWRIFLKRDVENADKGIPKLNDYLVRHVIGKGAPASKEVVEKLAKEVAWGRFTASNARIENIISSGEAVIVVPDDQWKNLNTDESRELAVALINKAYEGETVDDVFILSETKYKEIQALTKAFEKDGKPYPTMDHYVLKPGAVPLPEAINVKSRQVVVDAYIKDLMHLSSISNPAERLKELKEYYALREQYTIVRASYNEGVSLYNTDTWKRLQQSAQRNLMLYEFYDLLGTDDLNFGFIAEHFFNGAFFVKGFDVKKLVDNEPDLFARLRLMNIKGKSADVVVVDAIEAMQAKYGDSVDPNLNYHQTFTMADTNELLRLQGMVMDVVRNLEKTNRVVQQQLKPLIEKELERQMDAEDVAVYVGQELAVHEQFGEDFYNELAADFERPLAHADTLSKFSNIAHRYYGNNSTALEVQQYYVGLVHDIYKTAQSNHRKIIKKNENSNLNFAAFKKLVDLFNTFEADPNFTGVMLREQLKTIIKIDDATDKYLTGLANKIWATGKATAVKSAEELKNFIVYQYVLRSALVSIRQHISRYTDFYGGMLGAANATQAEQMLKDLEPEYHAYVKEYLDYVTDKANTDSNPARYKFSEEVLLYKGMQRSRLSNFYTPNIQEYYKTPRISDYFLAFMEKQWGYVPDVDDVAGITNNISKVLDTVMDYLYKSTSSAAVSVPLPKLPEKFTSMEDIKKDMRAKGLSEAAISLAFKLQKFAKAYFLTPEEIEAFKNRELDNETFNAYINAITKARKENRTLADIKVRKSYGVKETIARNRIDVLERSPQFFEYLIQIIGGNDANYVGASFDDIAKVFRKYGVNELILNQLLSREFNDVNHFMNAVGASYSSDTPEAMQAVALLSMFVNYHKIQYIRKNYPGIEWSNAAELEKVFSDEHIQDRSNMRLVQNIDITGVFESGSAVHNNVSFAVARDFNLIRKINHTVNYMNDRLGNLIVENKPRHNKYNVEYTPIVFADNPIVKLAQEFQGMYYDALFRESESGLAGQRAYQLLLERSATVVHMIAENNAQSYDQVGAYNKEYLSINEHFTKVQMILQGKNFRPYQFIRVRDVNGAIKLITNRGGRELVGYYIAYYEDQYKKAESAYVDQTARTVEERDKAREEFKREHGKQFSELEKLFNGSTKLVLLDNKQLRAIIGLIMTQRFESEEFHKNLESELSAYAAKQLKVSAEDRRRRRASVRNRINEIVLDEKLTDAEKEEALAQLHGHSFSTLDPATQKQIKDTVILHNTIRTREFDWRRWDDTWVRAQSDKSKTSADNTVQGRLLVGKEKELRDLKASHKSTSQSIGAIKHNLMNPDKLRSMFALPDPRPGSIVSSPKDVYNYTATYGRPDFALSYAAQRLEIAEENVRVLTAQLTSLKKKQTAAQYHLVKNLMEMYPTITADAVAEIRKYYGTVEAKLAKELEDLNKATNERIVKGYKEYRQAKVDVADFETRPALMLYNTIRNQTSDYLTQEKRQHRIAFDIYNPEHVALATKIFKDDLGTKTIQELHDEIQPLVNSYVRARHIVRKGQRLYSEDNEASAFARAFVAATTLFTQRINEITANTDEQLIKDYQEYLQAKIDRRNFLTTDPSVEEFRRVDGIITEFSTRILEDPEVQKYVDAIESAHATVGSALDTLKNTVDEKIIKDFTKFTQAKGTIEAYHAHPAVKLYDTISSLTGDRLTENADKKRIVFDIDNPEHVAVATRLFKADLDGKTIQELDNEVSEYADDYWKARDIIEKAERRYSKNNKSAIYVRTVEAIEAERKANQENLETFEDTFETKGLDDSKSIHRVFEKLRKAFIKSNKDYREALFKDASAGILPADFTVTEQKVLSTYYTNEIAKKKSYTRIALKLLEQRLSMSGLMATLPELPENATFHTTKSRYTHALEKAKKLDTLLKSLKVTTTAPLKLPEIEGYEKEQIALFITLAVEQEVLYRQRKQTHGKAYVVSPSERQSIQNEMSKLFKDKPFAAVYRYVTESVGNHNRFAPHKHSYGHDPLTIDLSAYKGDMLKYAQVTLHNLNYKIHTTYNEVIDEYLKQNKEYDTKAAKGIEAWEHAENMLVRVERRNPQEASERSRKVVAGLLNLEETALDSMTYADVYRLTVGDNDDVVYTAAVDELNKFKAKVKSLQQFIISSNSLPTKEALRTRLNARIKSLEEQISTAKEAYKGLIVKEGEDFGVAHDNLNLYRHYYKIDKDLTDRELVDHIVAEFAKESNKTVKEIEDAIRNEGEYDIHNPYLDNVITHFNYVHQTGKKGPHAVLDIETMDLNGRTVPYQMSLLVVDDKGTIDVTTAYVNNEVFFDRDDNGNYGTELTKVYEQYKDMIKKRYAKQEITLTEEALETISRSQFDKLIERVSTVKNSDSFIKAFLMVTAEGNNMPVVAHNGHNFDYRILDGFINYVGNNLLVNHYFRMFRTEVNNDEAYKKIQESDADALTKEAQTIELLEQDLKRYEELLKDEDSILADPGKYTIIKDAITRKQNELLKLGIRRAVENAAYKADYIVNDELKETIIGATAEAFVTITNTLQDVLDNKVTNDLARERLILLFMRGVNPRMNEESAVRIVGDYVDRLINNVVRDYKALVEGTKAFTYVVGVQGVKNRVQSNLAKDLVTENEKPYPVSVRIKSIQRTIDNLKALKKIVGKAVNKDEIIAKLGADIKSNNELIKKLEDDIVRLNGELPVTERNLLLDKILEQSGKVEKRLNDIHARLASTINSVNRVITGGSLNADHLSSLETQHAINTKRIKVLLNNLYVVIKHLKNGADVSVLLENMKGAVDGRVFGVLNNKDAMQALQTELESIYKDFGSEFTPAESISEIETQVFNTLREGYKSLQEEQLKELNDATKALQSKLDKEDVQRLEIPVKSTYTADELKAIYELVTAEQTLAEKYGMYIRAVAKASKDLFHTVTKLNVPDVATLLQDPKNREVFNTLVERELAIVENSIKFLQFYDANKPEEVKDSVIGAMYNSLMTELGTDKDVMEEIKKESVMSLIGGAKPSKDMDDDEYHKVASQRLDIKTVTGSSKMLQDLNLGVMYRDVHEGDAKQSIQLLPNKVYGGRQEDVLSTSPDERGNKYVYTVVDDLYNQAQQVTYREGSKYIDVTFKYGYQTKLLRYSGGGSRGFEVRTYSQRYYLDDLSDLIKLGKHFYWTGSNDKEGTYILPYMKKEQLHYPTGVDSGYEAIKVLIEFITANHAKAFSKATADGFYKTQSGLLRLEEFRFSKDYVRVRDITEEINESFLNQVSMLNAAERTQYSLRKLYAGIYNNVMSRYKNLESEGIINDINEDFARTYNINSMDPLFLATHRMDLSRSAEGSAGNSVKLMERFRTQFPFKLNVNPIRTMLTHQHLYARFTANKLLNNLYRDIPDEYAPGKKLVETFVNGKYMEDFPNIRETLKRSFNGRNSQLFMPNVMTAQMHKEYIADAQHHQFGFTVPVAFAKDSRVPLDVIGIDKDFYMASMWGSGDKTWLGIHYGFKGAVMPIKDLYKTYGSYFVAHADSVFSRGTQGVYGEMLFNYIRAYILNETQGLYDPATKTTKQVSVVPADKLPLFDQLNKDNWIVNTFKQYITEDGVFLIDPRKNDLLYKSLNTRIKEVLPQAAANRDVNTLYQLLLEAKVSKDAPTVYTKAIVEDHRVTYKDIGEGVDSYDYLKQVNVRTDFSGATFVRGLVYVFGDNEHSTQSMHTVARVDKEGNVTFPIIDMNDSVLKGFNLSPTTIYALLPKVGEDIFKVFPVKDERLELYARVSLEKFDKFLHRILNLNANSFVIEEEYKKLDALKEANELDDYLYEQALRYVNMLDLRNSEPMFAAQHQTDIDKLVYTTSKQLNLKMHGGTNSIQYRSYFRRHDGFRQQFLADTTLDVGEIIVSKKAWEYMLERAKSRGLFNTTQLDSTKTAEVLALLQDMSFTYQKEELLSHGILQEHNETLWTVLEHTSAVKRLGAQEVKDYFTTHNINTELQGLIEKAAKGDLSSFTLNQTYAYVLGARSPVQDTGAVPVFKVIGYSNSYAARVNPYAYTMMGADNDGDTFGMALVNIDHVENGGPLAPLLATNFNYYSFDEDVRKDGSVKHYLVAQNPEMFGKGKDGEADIDLENNEYVYHMKEVEPLTYEFVRNWTGKNTFPKYKNQPVRANGSYTYIELYRMLDPSIITSLSAKVKDKLDFTITDKADLRLFSHVYSRLNKDKALELSNYFHDRALEDFYHTHKTEINTLYLVEKGIANDQFVYGKDIVLSDTNLLDHYKKEFTADEQLLLNRPYHVISAKDLPQYNRLMQELITLALIDQADISTVARVLVSKNGVNFGGGKRKDQMVSSFISTYKNINLSKKGYFWSKLGAADEQGFVTMERLFLSLFYKSVEADVKPLLDARVKALKSAPTTQELYDMRSEIRADLLKKDAALSKPKYLESRSYEDVVRIIKTNKEAFKDPKQLEQLIDRMTNNPVVLNRNQLNDMHLYFKDYPQILEDLVKVVGQHETIEDELKRFTDLWTRRGTTSNGDVRKFLEHSSIKDDGIMRGYLKILSTLPPHEPVGKGTLVEIAMQYFNNAYDLKRFLKDGFKNEYREGFIKQYMIERVALNYLSNSMTRIIAVAKHNAMDENSVESYNTYAREVTVHTDKTSKRGTTLGGRGIEHYVNMAINADREIYADLDYELEGVSNSDLNKMYYEKNPNGATPLFESYTDPVLTTANINAHINDRGKMVLKGNMNTPNTTIERVREYVKILNNSMRNPYNLGQDYKELEQAIKFFNRNDISYGNLVRWLTDSVSIGLAIKNIYDANVAEEYNLNNVGLYRNITNIRNLFYLLKDPEFKEAFILKYSTQPVLYNFFMNTLSLDETLQIKDPLEGTINITAEEQAERLRGDVVHNDEYQHKNTLEDQSIKTVNQDLLDTTEYHVFNTAMSDYATEIENLKLEIMTLLKMETILDEKYAATQENIKNNRIRTKAQRIWSNPRVRNLSGYNLIKLNIREITKHSNSLFKTQEKIKLTKKEIEDLRTKVLESQKAIEGLENFKTFASNNSDLSSQIDAEILANEQALTDHKNMVLRKAINDNIGNGVLYLRNKDGLGLADITISKPRYLSVKDFEDFKRNALTTMANEVTLLKNMLQLNGDPAHDRKELQRVLRYINENIQDQKLVIVIPPEEDEGRYKTIFDNVRKYSEAIDGTLHGKGTAEDYEALRFKSLDEMAAYKGRIVFQGKVYTQLDPALTAEILKDNQHLSPTYKEYEVHTIEQLAEIYKHHIESDLIIGFVNTNTWMKSMEKVYRGQVVPKGIQQVAYKLQMASKYISRFTLPFLVRNLADTVTQLYSNSKINLTLTEKHNHMSMTMTAIELHQVYKKLSDEMTMLVMNASSYYEDLLELSKVSVKDPVIIKKKIDVILRYLESYVAIGNTTNTPRIVYRVESAKRIMHRMQILDYKQLNQAYLDTVENAVRFISNIEFGEFVELYDPRVIDGQLVAGVRIDNYNTEGKVIKHKRLDETIEGYDWKKVLLKELSYFMNTAATNDYLKKDRFDMLPAAFAAYRGYSESEKDKYKSYDELKKKLKELRKTKGGFIDNLAIVRGYNWLNTEIENGARIANFFYNVMLYNKTVDDAVLDSLHHWFNYGMRSPLEQRLMADIPFISFPIRSISNWLDRLLSPQYWRLMSDLLDGWYGQYVDEDKEYDDFMKFQMANGWIPLGHNFGIRLGNGAFDVMNILYNTSAVTQQRRSPILRAVSKLIETKDVVEALKQLATVGIITRNLNSITGITDLAGGNVREGVSKNPLAQQVLSSKKATIGNTSGLLYDNYQYTPYKYRNNNGRYKYYENLYRDWFTKYGKMRKPKVDPMSLVKDIQWRTYVRWKRNPNK